MTSVHCGTAHGFETLILENSRVRAVIVPALGGRVWELEDRVRGRQWIWHRNDVGLEAVPTGSVYDDVWAGGWEELFPNDAAGRFEGRDLPDHGEWWTLRWAVEEASAEDAAYVRLAASTTVVRASCTKEFLLEEDAATLSVRYRIRSEEPHPFHFLFKQHVPISITPDCRLVLAGGRVQAVDPTFGTLVRSAAVFDWPGTVERAESIDLRIVPPSSSGAREFVYVRDLPESWCGVDDRRHGASIRMDFSREQLPFVWFFLSYGGWRNVYTAVLEPCSNMPKDLAAAARLGQSARLGPGQEFATAVSVTLGGEFVHGSRGSASESSWRG